MGAIAVKVDSSGRLVIPREMREELGIPTGGMLTLSAEGGVLRAQTRLPRSVTCRTSRPCAP